MDEWDSIPISRLSHAGYCLRRAALLTNEQLWAESADTAKGRREHDRVHDARIEKRGNELKLYEYAVFSDELGISGKCDCIEAVRDEAGCRIPAADFPVRLYPVEFKHGRVREEEESEIQLCAQAMCLEEMYETSISEGAIFYISSHRRLSVKLDDDLRRRVSETVKQVRRIQQDFIIPPTEPGPKCARCSIKEICMPDAPTSAEKYCEKMRKEATGVL